MKASPRLSLPGVRGGISLVVVATSLAATVSADAAAPTSSRDGEWTLLRHHVAKSKYPMNFITMEIKEPRTIGVRVSARPRRALLGSWSAYCRTGFKGASARGHFSGTGTVTHLIRLPRKHPASCIITGGASLASPPRLVARASETTLTVQLLTEG